MQVYLPLLVHIVQIQSARDPVCLQTLVLLTVQPLLDKFVDALEVQSLQALMLATRTLLQWQRDTKRMLLVTPTARVIMDFGHVLLLQAK